MPADKREVTSIAKRAGMMFETRTVDDIMQALSVFIALKPEYTRHKFPDGVTRWCFSLGGTIPIDYKGSTYHIPIALYLMDNHPYSGPFCYVRPTETMQIRVSQVVDDKGRIYLPYLTEWRYPGYSTMGLLQIMKKAFEERSPVYSKAAAPSNSYPTSQLSQARSNNQPYPMGGGSGGLPYPSTASQPHVGATPYPMQNTFPSASGSSVPSAYPPAPLLGSGVSIGSSGGGIGAGYQPPYQPYPGFTSAASMGSMDADSSRHYSGYNSYGTIQPNHIRSSLISAIEDKIRSRLREKIGRPFAELQSVESNLQELRSGQQRLKEMLENLERDQTQLEIIITTYQDKKAELEKALAACNANGMAKDDIDEAIDATTPLHRQIFRCYVADCAIDDAIYFLGQALKRGNINIQIYLKYVRQLSRKQFVHRATMQKCRLKAKLPI